ncbi:MAG: 6-phosphogluconolactonase, partial [Actinomycetota bacterium]
GPGRGRVGCVFWLVRGSTKVPALFPDDPALQVLRDPVALTEERAGHRRLTLTRPVLDRARCVFWLVRGSTKVPALGRLLAGDLTIPAGLIRPAHSVVVADAAAARQA